MCTAHLHAHFTLVQPECERGNVFVRWSMRLWILVVQRPLNDVIMTCQHVNSSTVSNNDTKTVSTNDITIYFGIKQTNTHITSLLTGFVENVIGYYFDTQLNSIHPFSNTGLWKKHWFVFHSLSQKYTYILFVAFCLFTSWMPLRPFMFNLFVLQLWWTRPVRCRLPAKHVLVEILTIAWIFAINCWNFSFFYALEYLYVVQRIKQTMTIVFRAELSCMVLFYSGLVQWRYLSLYSVKLILPLDVQFFLSPLFQGPPGRPGFPVTVFCHCVYLNLPHLRMRLFIALIFSTTTNHVSLLCIVGKCSKIQLKLKQATSQQSAISTKWSLH